MEARGRQPNLSFFAFTATPKQKTRELFGTSQPDGSFRPFHLYTMRQAIEEGFILDVLQNYTTFTTYFNLQKKVADDPHVEKSKTAALLKREVELHQYTIDQKTALMVEHFWDTVRHQIPDNKGDGRDCKLFCVSGLKYIQIAGDRHEKTTTAPDKSRPPARRIIAGLHQS
jgi:type I restriction enzyme R subunit